ncbi:MAG: undecaprenyl-phosphate glucose phosphotransferase [Oceanospirillaceae bacterium]|nr:undecaprenyl-phosphate glucose phosphotransferase [Oceanospirillaceae bacterium]
MTMVAGLLGLLTWLKTGTFETQYRILAVIAILGSVPAYTAVRVYDSRREGSFSGLMRLLGGWLLLLSMLSVVAFLTKTSDNYSREVLLKWAMLGYLVQAVTFLPIHELSRVYHQRLREKRKAVILGNNALAQQLADVLVNQRFEPLAGLVTLERTTGDEAETESYPLLGNVEQLRQIIAEQGIRRLYIALPFSEMKRIERLYIDLLDVSVDVVWIPDLASLVMLNQSVSSIGGLPAIHLNECPLSSRPRGAFVKAALDRSIALLAIVLLSPLLIATAFAVKLSSPGPVLFKQQRHGWNGEVIKVWKFRSMRVHQDAQVKQATREDPRITAVGRFIRRTSIDELPQLFNVLFGDMSLVGPRPHALAHNDYYADKITAYMARHRIKPGITGLAQISGARGETETIDKMAKRVEFDLHYISNWSVWLDIKILLKTPLSLVSKDIY